MQQTMAQVENKEFNIGSIEPQEVLKSKKLYRIAFEAGRATGHLETGLSL